MSGEMKFAFGDALAMAPKLKPCPCCGGEADYVTGHEALRGKVYRAWCSRCGLQTEACVSAAGVGEDWNRRAANGARVITLEEIAEARFANVDEAGYAAVWFEHLGNALQAVLIRVGIDLGERTVEEITAHGAVEWSESDVAGEGIHWRLWDKRPTKEERAAEPWGRVKWRGGHCEAARKQAEALRRAWAEARERERLEREARARRRCLFCAEFRLARVEGANPATEPARLCALDGHALGDLYGRCDHWRDGRAETEAARAARRGKCITCRRLTLKADGSGFVCGRDGEPIADPARALCDGWADEREGIDG